MNTHNYSAEQRDEIETLMAGAALDALSEADLQRLETYFNQDPNLELEFAQYLECAVAWAETVPQVAPPQRLRQQIRQTAQADIFPIVWRSRLPEWNWRTLVLLVCLALTTITGFTNLSLRRRLQVAELKLEYFQESEDTHVHLLQGGQTARPVSDSPYGSVLIDTVTNRAILALKNVRPLQPGEVYAMWATLQGKTVLCGQFQSYSDGHIVDMISVPPNLYPPGVEITVFITIESSKDLVQPSQNVLMKTQLEI